MNIPLAFALPLASTTVVSGLFFAAAVILFCAAFALFLLSRRKVAATASATIPAAQAPADDEADLDHLLKNSSRALHAHEAGDLPGRRDVT